MTADAWRCATALLTTGYIATPMPDRIISAANPSFNLPVVSIGVPFCSWGKYLWQFAGADACIGPQAALVKDRLPRDGGGGAKRRKGSGGRHRRPEGFCLPCQREVAAIGGRRDFSPPYPLCLILYPHNHHRGRANPGPSPMGLPF